MWKRRSGLVQLSLLLGLVGYVMSLGPSLNIDNHQTGISMPFSLLYHSELLSQEIPARYVLYSYLFASVVVAVGIDSVVTIWHEHSATWFSGASIRRSAFLAKQSATAAGFLACTGVVLIPLLPQWPYPGSEANIPSYFTTASNMSPPLGSVMLTYPYPWDDSNQAMLWQAAADFRFSIIGDYANTPVEVNPSGGGIYPPTLRPTSLELMFRLSYYGLAIAVDGQTWLPYNSFYVGQTRLFLRRYRVATVVLDPIGLEPYRVTKFITLATGHRPVESGGVQVWNNVQADLHSVAGQ
jgi:hypothetical protein